MRSRLLGAGLVLLAVACGNGKSPPLPCDPTFDANCNVTPGQNSCHSNADCGDGKCLPDGTCQAPGTASQASLCTGVTCKPTEFCSNGLCLLSGPVCKPADSTCIFVPHGAFEPPENQWWWPFRTAAGPPLDQKQYPHNMDYRTDLLLPDFVQVMDTPVVMRLHPKDAAPAVVFNSFRSVGGEQFDVETHAVMRAVNGADGSPIWTAPASTVADPDNNLDPLAPSVDGNAQIAAGDCTGSGEVCFITGGFDPQDVDHCDKRDGTTGHCRISTLKTCNVNDALKQPDVCTQYSHQHGGLIAFGNDGRKLWYTPGVQVQWGAPAIARLLGTPGPAQVVVGNGVYDGKTGRMLCPQTTAPLDQIGGNGDGTVTAIADINLDGTPEIITGNQAYRLTPDAASATGYTCKALFRDGVITPYKPPNCPYGQMQSSRTGQQVCLCPNGFEDICPDGFPAIANFAGYGAKIGLDPKDPHPQIVVASHGFLRIQDWTGGMLLNPIPLPSDPNCADANEGGAPTIADFDGDGLPEIGIAGQGGYVVWKPAVGFIWTSKTEDCSSNTGSSVFDFEGKGQANVVYSDQCNFRVYDGRTGHTLVEQPNSSCTAYEMPIVADIDGTGRARVLVPTNNVCNYKCGSWPATLTVPPGTYDPRISSSDLAGTQAGSKFVGLRALRSPSDKWVNTRSVWNEHNYHVTNVNLDGSLPYPEPNSWASGESNSYRQNVQGVGTFSAPDLSICEVKVDMTACQSASRANVTATLYNGGALVVRSGVSITFYAVLQDGSTAQIGSGATSRALNPGDAQDVTIVWIAPPQTQAVTIKAVADEKNLVGVCHPENKTATAAQPVRCSPLG